MKKAEMLLEKWGPYALALLCAAVILLSALWTRRDTPAPGDAAALSDGSQRLADVTAAPERPVFCRPTAGEILTGYSESPVYFPGVGLWKTHPALDFAAEAGERVRALGDGVVAGIGADGLILALDEGFRCQYRGVAHPQVAEGQRVRAGDCLGLAGEGVPFEGNGRICVAVEGENGKTDWTEWIDSGGK